MSTFPIVTIGDSGVAVTAGGTGVAAGWEGVCELTCPPPVAGATPTGVAVNVGTGVFVGRADSNDALREPQAAISRTVIRKVGRCNQRMERIPLFISIGRRAIGNNGGKRANRLYHKLTKRQNRVDTPPSIGDVATRGFLGPPQLAGRHLISASAVAGRFNSQHLALDRVTDTCAQPGFQSVLGNA